MKKLKKSMIPSLHRQTGHEMGCAVDDDDVDDVVADDVVVVVVDLTGPARPGFACRPYYSNLVDSDAS